MNIDQLTKSQIVLLTLFTSFVTSIATGIVTIALFQQAPPAITHTISKVVQTTVEKVIEPSKENKTVVVNYEDELANAVAKQSKQLVRIHKQGADENTPGDFVALGFVATKDGTVLADADRVAQGQAYVALYNGDKTAPVAVQYQGESLGVAVMKLSTPQNAPPTPVTTVSAGSIRLGQTLYALAGPKTEKLVSATVSGFDRTEKDGKTTTNAIFTGLALGVLDSGTAVFAADGKTVGMAIVRDGAVKVITFEILEAFLTPPPTPAE